MIITTIKTKPITYPSESIFAILDQYLPPIKEKSIVVITSKILAISQGRVVKNDGHISKEQLIRKEAEYYLPEKPHPSVTLTVKNNVLIASAGIDESNGAGYFILWPENIQETTNTIRAYLVKKYSLRNLGVLITDSHLTPMRTGTIGLGLAHSGFAALHNYIGEPDVFGKKLTVTRHSIIDGLAGASVVVMGEGREQTPLAVITDIPFVRFQSRNPTKKELANLRISLDEDIFGAILTYSKLKKGNAQ